MGRYYKIVNLDKREWSTRTRSVRGSSSVSRSVFPSGVVPRSSSSSRRTARV